jgi:hypothetical protein
MLQLGFGLNPLQSGSITFLATAGALIGSAFIAAHGLFTDTTPFWLMMVVLLLGGCFRSLQFTFINAIGYADLASKELGSATSILGVTQQLSLSIGVALGGFVLDAAAQARGGGALIAADFAPAFFAVAAVSALSVFSFWRLKPDAGAEMFGHRAAGRNTPSTGMGDGMNER